MENMVIVELMKLERISTKNIEIIDINIIILLCAPVVCQLKSVGGLQHIVDPFYTFRLQFLSRKQKQRRKRNKNEPKEEKEEEEDETIEKCAFAETGRQKQNKNRNETNTHTHTTIDWQQIADVMRNETDTKMENAKR